VTRDPADDHVLHAHRGDFLYDAIIMEELGYARAHCLQASLHTDICLPYLASFGTEAQKQKFLVPAIAGDCLVAIAMTEPSTGSDLAAVRTTAIRDGDHYIVNGAKTFISNGQNSHLVIVVAKTNPALRHDGISLMLVEEGTPGFERGRNLEKIGLKGQDTSERSGSGFSSLFIGFPWKLASLASRCRPSLPNHRGFRLAPSPITLKGFIAHTGRRRSYVASRRYHWARSHLSAGQFAGGDLVGADGRAERRARNAKPAGRCTPHPCCRRSS
jgi:hypothetical protein